MHRLEVYDLVYHGLGPFQLGLAAGECVSLSGPSGSGKTLLLRCLADIEAHQGRMVLNGTVSSRMPAHEWRRQVGLLLAESAWWSERVGEHFKQWNESFVEQLGLEASVAEWPVSRCSSGERQRLALIRLLVQEPQVLLLDEPTSHLDPNQTERVEELVAHHRKVNGTSVLWVNHDSAQRARIASRNLMLEDGQLREEKV